MMLCRTSIIDATHGGLQIYAYVLKQFYPKEALVFAKNRCRPARNPFNKDHRSLLILMEQGEACHRDLDLPSFSGDPFDFANLYFKSATREELYYMINQVMHLGLKVAAEEALSWLDNPDDSWRPRISFYKPPIRNIFPSEELSLGQLHLRITERRYAGITSMLREMKDVKQRRLFKATNFAYVTFSGTFRHRSDEALKQESGLIVFDFDHVPDPSGIGRRLLQDEYFETEMLFRSPSGDGLKWVIRKDPPSSHREFFLAVVSYLKQTYQLEADASGKDVSRACFVPHDPEAFLHPRHRLESSKGPGRANS